MKVKQIKQKKSSWLVLLNCKTKITLEYHNILLICGNKIPKMQTLTNIKS